MHGAQAQMADPYAERAAAPPRALAPHWQNVELGKGTHRYPFALYANKAWTPADLRGIKRVVIMLHGAQRDADQYYETLATLLAHNPALAPETLIVAPKFAGTIDTGFGALPAWRKASWEDGENSVSAKERPAPVSSFQVLDDLLSQMNDRKLLPALENIVLAGHSGGAQLVQRYAVLNMADGPIQRNGVNLRYVVANPSSYHYLRAERPRAYGKGYDRYERGICPTYNQYKYGPDRLPGYSKETDESKLFVRYAARNVTYLLGSADNNPEHRLLDKSCGAEAHGATRLARGLAYFRYEVLLAKQGAHPLPLRHSAFEVIGVDHDQKNMFGSQCGVQALLGDTAQSLDGGADCKPVAASK